MYRFSDILRSKDLSYIGEVHRLFFTISIFWCVSVRSGVRAPGRERMRERRSG